MIRSFSKPKFQVYQWMVGVLITVLISSPVYPQEFDDSYKNRALIRKGDSLRFAQSWDSAIETYNEAEEAAKNEENWAGYIYSINQAGYCYRRKNEYPEAKKLFDLALDEAPQLLGEYHPEIARTYYHLGYYYWNYTNPWNMDSSLWARKRSVEINENSDPVSQEDLSLSYMAMASLQNEGYLNRFDAIDLYEKALKIRLEILPPDHPDLAKTFSFLGLTYFNLDDHPRAQIYIKSAIEIFNSSSQSSPFDKYSAYNNLGVSYLEMRDYENAFFNIKKSSEIITKRYGADDYDQVNRYNNLGLVYISSDQIDSARKYVNWALEINLSESEPDTTLLADSYSHLGAIQLKEGSIDSAEYFYNTAITLFAGDDFRVSENLSFLAEAYIKVESYEKAKELSLKAINVLEQNPENNALDLDNPKQPIAVFYPLLLLARAQTEIYRQSGSNDDFNEALSYFIQLEQLKDLIRNASFSNEAKYLVSDLFISSTRGFLSLINQNPDNKDVEDVNDMVFQIMERNRYSELFRNVVNIQNSSKINVPDSLLRLEKLLASQIAVYRQEDLEVDSIRTSQLLKFEREYQAIKQALSNTFPSYYESKYGGELIDLTSVQSKLEKHEQVLEYFWGEELVTILSITSNSLDLHFTPSNNGMESRILELLSFCSESPSLTDSPEELYTYYEPLAISLYDQLVKSILKVDTKKVIIIPDGPISIIPFEALLAEAGNGTFFNAPFLVKELGIRYGYSTQLLFREKEKSKVKMPGLLAMAYSEGYKSLAELERKGEMNIPGSGLELTSIQNIFNHSKDRYLFGDEASETAFKKEASDYGIIHLAIHGIGDTTNAFNSHLIFPDKADKENDGRLYAHELYGLEFLNLNLVVLSACKTGIGKEYPGEGIFSMSRGFRYSGASSTIMSLWDVADNTTAQVMENFYANLESGTNVSGSLRSAQLEFLDQADSRFSHPSYWAAFVVIGKDVRLLKSKIYHFITILICIVIGSISMIYILRKRNQKKSHKSVKKYGL